MLSIIDSIRKNTNAKILKEGKLYIQNYKSDSISSMKDNLFARNKMSPKKGDLFINMFDFYGMSRNNGGIYLLTNNIENISFLYEEILKNIELPDILIEFLENNIKSYKINGKINVIKDISYLKLILIDSKFFNETDFSEIKYNIKDDKNILNDKLVEYSDVSNSILLKLLFFRNVTTIFNRKTYEPEEAIQRIKRDYQRLMINFVFDNGINNSSDINIFHINQFIYKFGNEILKYYLFDYIYHMLFYKKMHRMEAYGNINHFLLEIEGMILEDYYIINEENAELYGYIKNNMMKILKNSINGKKIEDSYIVEGNLDWLSDFFNYNIYY